MKRIALIGVLTVCLAGCGAQKSVPQDRAPVPIPNRDPIGSGGEGTTMAPSSEPAGEYADPATSGPSLQPATTPSADPAAAEADKGGPNVKKDF